MLIVISPVAHEEWTLGGQLQYMQHHCDSAVCRLQPDVDYEAAAIETSRCCGCTDSTLQSVEGLKSGNSVALLTLVD